MAGLIVGLVLDRYPSEADLGELMVALVLADAADHDGSNVRPSVARIARLARQSERSVQYKLRDMQNRGFIHLVRQGGGKGRPSEYCIDISWLENLTSRAGGAYGARPAPIVETVHAHNQNAEPSLPERCSMGASQVAPNPPPLTPDPSDPHHIEQRPESAPSGGGSNCLPEEIEQAIADELQGRMEAAARGDGPPVRYPDKWVKALRRRALTGEAVESEYGKAVRLRREAEARIQQALVAPPPGLSSDSPASTPSTREGYQRHRDALLAFARKGGC
jgi:hypothetical protein